MEPRRRAASVTSEFRIEDLVSGLFYTMTAIDHHTMHSRDPAEQ